MLVGKALGAPLKGSLLLLALSFGATNAVLDVNGDPIPIPGTCDNTDFGLIEDDVDGYPCSPFGLKPWGQTYKTTEDFNPPRKEKVDTVYRSDGHSAEVYEYDVKGVQANLFTSILPDGDCDGDDKKTRLISYGGHVPAATMYVRDGKETYVQFNNLITEEDAPRPEMFNFEGCNHDDKTGLPITTHNHGQAALAPFDGYAEDRTCYGESKAYMYPNNRPTTGWFHDHALHQTGANVLFGLYGFYIISEKTEVGGCGEPYNLDLMEEVLLFINDVVIDPECQIRWDVDDGHKNNYYGDINLVNGHPFPVLELTRKWYRFRVLNGSVTRPYLLRLVTPDGDDVSSELCTIIGTDGGYFEKGPTPFPATGLMAGVAERWDMVCDFSGLGVSELVLYNDVDERRMKDVPYFTYSHFVAKFTFTGEEDTTAPVFDPENRGHIGTFVPETVLSGAIEVAEGMIENGEAHRTFKFGRGNGHWVINGETWETDRVAADDVGQNTWELWEIDSGGGWFHPVHLHLIDFFILARKDADGVFAPDLYGPHGAPKDVMYLGPGETIYVIARFGPHKGEYMFHCHNLRHEDNDMLRTYITVERDLGLNAGDHDEAFIEVNGIIYDNYQYANPTVLEPFLYDSGDNVMDRAQEYIDKNFYRIFYPLPNDTEAVLNNPWLAAVNCSDVTVPEPPPQVVDGDQEDPCRNLRFLRRLMCRLRNREGGFFSTFGLLED